MHDAETRALRHAIVVLLVLSALRWGWSALRPPAHIQGTDVLPTLVEESRARLRPPPPARAARDAGGPVDLNRADEAALETLPGIGPALARRILAARRQKPFGSVEDLARVRGIGPATVKRLRGRVTVRR